MVNTPPRMAVYCRVSSEEQRLSETISNQVDFARRYCSLHGLVIADFYLDDGVSGTLPLGDRPAGRRLLEDAARGSFGGVLVYRIDRLARKTIHLLDCYERLDRLGIALRSMTESFDTDTPSGRFVMTMFASIAALERDTLLDRTALGRARRLREGKWISGSPPFGYCLNEHGCLSIDPKEAAIVRRIFDLYTGGEMSTLTVADYLNGTRVPVASVVRNRKGAAGGRWRASRVLRILSDPVYVGRHVGWRQSADGSRESIEITAPSLVSDEVWAAAQEMRKLRAGEARRNSKRLYLLRALVRCGFCGNVYVGDGRVSRTRAYYRCLGGHNVDRSLPRRCPAPALQKDYIETQVWNDVHAFLVREDVISLLLRHLQGPAAGAGEDEVELNAIKGAQMMVDQAKQRLLRLYVDGVVSDQEIHRELNQLDGQRQALLARRAVLDRGRSQSGLRSRIGLQVSEHGSLTQVLSKGLDSAPFESKRRLILMLVDHIAVEPIENDGNGRGPCARVVIHYRFGLPERRTDCLPDSFES